MQDLYLFNPDNEISIANGTNGYTPKANISIMADDLAFLSAYLAGKGDYVLVTKMPDFDFMKSREEVFGLDCKPVIWEKAQLLSFNEIKPWGWSPRVHNLLKELKSRCNEQFRESVMSTWSDKRRDLYSRRMAATCLAEMVRAIPCIGEDIIPRECNTLAGIRSLSEKEDVVVKAPWSSSGKGILFIPKGQMTCKEEEVLSGILRKQGYVMVEKRLNRVLDFAMEFCAGRQGVEFIGWSVFSTGLNGEYRGNYLGAQAYIEQLLGSKLGEEKLQSLKQELPDMIAGILPDYRGYLGRDMRIYADSAGKYRVQPCLEINLRYNMGIVALMLSRRYLDEHAEGEFTGRYYAKAGEAWQEHRHLQQLYPAVYKNNRIKSGYLNLTPVNEATHFVASLICY